MKRGAIFDMDGLMFDTEKYFGIAWEEQAVACGFEPVPAFHYAICGTSGPHARELVREYFPGIADANAFINDACARVEKMLAEEVPEKPGVHEILSWLKSKGVRLAVASSSEKELIEMNLAHARLENVFDAVVSGSQVSAGKPAPDIFLFAAKELGLSAEECYVFEDSFNGVRAGNAAGCVTVMIPDLKQPTDEVRGLCAGVYGSLNEALEAIRKDEI